jgi:MinD superfamily P-loop ATPase
MTVAIASGKGGTGKTTIAVGLAKALDRDVQLLDCDVEEPNDHLFLSLKEIRSVDHSIPVPRVDNDLCTACGKCSSFCEFNALALLKDRVLVFDNLCHGCGGCTIICPEQAIREEDRPAGKIVFGRSGRIEHIYGDLNTGEAMAPPLIRAVKREITGEKPAILDSPPGTTCPMVTAVKDADFCLLVTENTPFGLHDLEMAVEVLGDMHMPMGVVINRSDIGKSGVKEFCREKNIPVLLEVPYSRNIAEKYAVGLSIVDAEPEYRRKLVDLYAKIEELAADKAVSPTGALEDAGLKKTGLKEAGLKETGGSGGPR